MRIFITGGAGFIGSHVADRLVQRGDSVTVLDNLARGLLANLAGCAARTRFVQADIRNRTAVADAMRNADLVYHLAAQSNVMGAVQDPDNAFSSNVEGTYRVLQAARLAGVKRVVFTSSREVYGDPQSTPVSETAPIRPKNAYGTSKAAGELYCRLAVEQGLQVVILRVANAYGTRDRQRVIPIFIENALHGLPLLLYGGKQILDFIHVDLVVEALLKAGLGEFIPEPVNIGSGQPVRLHELAVRVLELTGSKAPVQVEPARDSEVVRFVADVDRAARLLDWHPSADSLAGLAPLVESIKAGKASSARKG